MAYFDSVAQFDLNSINLYWYNTNYEDSGLADNAFVEVDGIVYEDLFFVDGYDGYNWLELVFLGSGMVENSNGDIVAGTVNFVGEIDLTTESLLWYIEGVSTSAVAIYNAALTPSNQDEIAIIEAALGGDDTIILSNFGDRMYGFAGNDEMYGYGGNDTLYGGSGADDITGGAGNDIIDGDAGLDAAWYDDALAGVTVNLATGTARSTVADNAGIGTDTLVEIEDVIGSLYADTLVGNSLDNSLDGNEGDDSIQGGAGHDDLFGHTGDDRLTGGTGDDLLLGEEGEDILEGGAGSDILDGGEDGDLYLVTAAADHAAAEIEDSGWYGTDELRFAATGTAQTLVLRSGDVGLDLIVIGTGVGTSAVISGLLAHNVDASALDYATTIYGNSGANTLRGGSGWDYLSGGNGIDRLYGNVGNDVLEGGREADVMYGGTGDDIYLVDHLSDAPIEAAAEGIDSVNASVSHTLKANVEGLTLTGIYSIHGTGNALNNYLVGNSGSNRLSGAAGNDTLEGWEGNDTLDGGAGADELRGYTGNDTYIVDNVGDLISEFDNHGIDKVRAVISWSLDANLENLELLGSADIDGTGNWGANVVVGNSGSNLLAGLGGNDKLYGRDGDDVLDGGFENDWLEGGAGTDEYTGGAGSDRFVFRNGDFGGADAATADVIHDFIRADGDRIRLDLVDANSTVDGNQAFAFLGTNAFTGVAGQLRYEQIGGNTFVQGDLDGDGAADFMIQVDGLVDFRAGDFIL